MAVLYHFAPITQSTPHLLSRIGAVIRDAALSYAHARSRSAELQFYFEMSDEELAAHDLRRDEIVRHVFRDQICF